MIAGKEASLQGSFDFGFASVGIRSLGRELGNLCGYGQGSSRDQVLLAVPETRTY